MYICSDNTRLNTLKTAFIRLDGSLEFYALRSEAVVILTHCPVKEDDTGINAFSSIVVQEIVYLECLENIFHTSFRVKVDDLLRYCRLLQEADEKEAEKLRLAFILSAKVETRIKGLCL